MTLPVKMREYHGLQTRYSASVICCHNAPKLLSRGLISCDVSMFDVGWDFTGMPNGDCRVIAYARYDSTSTSARETWLSSTVKVYLPLLKR